MYYENGVIVNPNVMVEGDNATIKYKGILYDSGADSVFVNIGYEPELKENKFIQMNRTEDGFEAKTEIKNSKQLKLSFKDSANNWDNNSSRNYCFEVQTRQ